MVDWRTLTPAQVLADFPSLTVGMAAYVLYPDKSEPHRRRLVRDRINDGAITVTDPTLPWHRVTITSDEVRRYLTHGPAKKAAS